MLCQNCKKSPRKTHLNSKWCASCANLFIAKPKGTMTKDQITQATKLAGKMDIKEIATKLGVSLSNLKRSMPNVSFAYHNKWALNKEFVKKVCAYYEKHGKTKTKEKFPEAKLRSIVERYKYFNPRSVRLTEEQFIELAKMGGLISLKGQAKFLSRPNAGPGSIKSFMYKRFQGGLVNLNGLHFNKAKYFCPIKWTSKAQGRATPNVLHCPHVITKYWKLNNLKDKGNAKLYLWVDIEKNMRDESPQFLREAVNACASFQRWIWKTDNPRTDILKMIQEREIK